MCIDKIGGIVILNEVKNLSKIEMFRCAQHELCLKASFL
jgi:hypothetical protein